MWAESTNGLIPVNIALDIVKLVSGIKQKYSVDIPDIAMVENEYYIACMDILSEKIGMTTDILRLNSRKSEIIYPRAMISILLFAFTGLTCTYIGRFFGINHASILNYKKTVSSLISSRIRPYDNIFIEMFEKCLSISKELNPNLEILPPWADEYDSRHKAMLIAEIGPYYNHYKRWHVTRKYEEHNG